MRYFIVAKSTSRSTHVIDYEEFEAQNDTDATFEAMKRILNKAHARPSGPWAKRYVALRKDSLTGRVLQDMKEK